MDAIALLTLPEPSLVVPFLSGLLLGAAFFGSALFYIGWCGGRIKEREEVMPVVRQFNDRLWGLLPMTKVDGDLHQPHVTRPRAISTTE